MFSENETATLSKDLAAFRYVSTTATNNLQGILASHEKLIADYKSLLSDYEETKDARDRYKRQAKGTDSTPFVVALIDGDNYPFDDAFVGKAADGGTNAAEFLHAFFKDHIRKLGLAPETKLVVRYVVNLAEASRMAHHLGLTGSHSRSLATFTAAFASAKPLCDVIDSGDRPSTTEAKIKENFELFANTNACKHIFFAGCNSQKNLDLLKPYERRLEKITLIRNSQSWPQFSSLGLRTEELTFVFRDGRAPTPERSSTNSSSNPKVGKYVPPSQRRESDESFQQDAKRRPTTSMSQHQSQRPSSKSRLTYSHQDLLKYRNEPGVPPPANLIQHELERDDQRTPRPPRREPMPPPDDSAERPIRRDYDSIPSAPVDNSETDHYGRTHERHSRRDAYNADIDNHNAVSDAYSGLNGDTTDGYSHPEAWADTRQSFDAQSPEMSKTQWKHKQKSNEQQQPFCTHWVRGVCKYGETCKKRHEVPIDPRGPGILDNYGEPSRAAVSNDWRAPEKAAATPSRIPGPVPPHRALGQRGSTLHGRAYSEDLDGAQQPNEHEPKVFDVKEVLENLPRRADANLDLIPVNNHGWRLDYYPGKPPSKPAIANYKELIATFEPCKDFLLKGKCKEGAHCAKEHAPLTAELTEVLRWDAHDSPCKKQGDCRDRDCYSGHICYSPNCKDGRRFTGCRLPTKLHQVDPLVADYVPAVVPHEELSEEDRQLAGQPIEVIEGDLLGVEEDVRPVNKLNMTSRWAQNMPNPHQSGDNTPTGHVNDDSPLIPADDSSRERQKTPGSRPNGGATWDPFMPSPTQKKISANGMNARAAVNGRSTPKFEKFSFEPPTDEESVSDDQQSDHEWQYSVPDDHINYNDGYESDGLYQAPTPEKHDKFQSRKFEGHNGGHDYSSSSVPSWHPPESIPQKPATPDLKSDTPQTQQGWANPPVEEQSRHQTPASVKPLSQATIVQSDPATTAEPSPALVPLSDVPMDDELVADDGMDATDDKVTDVASPSVDRETSFASTGPASESVDELFDTESRTPTSRSPLPVAAQPVATEVKVPAEQASTDRQPSPVARPESETSARLNVSAVSFVPGSTFVPGASSHKTASPSPSLSATAPPPASSDISPPTSSTPFSPLGDSKHAPKPASPTATKTPKTIPPTETTTSNPPDPAPIESTPTSKKKKSHSRNASSLTAVRGDHGKTDSFASRQTPRSAHKSGDARNYAEGREERISEGQSSHDSGGRSQTSFGDGEVGRFDSWNASSQQVKQDADAGGWGQQEAWQGSGGQYAGDGGNGWGYGANNGWNNNSWGQEQDGWQGGRSAGGANGNGRGAYGRSQRNDTSGYGRGRGWGGTDEQGYGNDGAGGVTSGDYGYVAGGYGSGGGGLEEFGLDDEYLQSAMREQASMQRSHDDVMRDYEEGQRRGHRGGC
ncbi:hypothetical protein KVT40_001666 [Elsinoe batatas]|uniref:C3H1-type domain-containing protein n=1 Tax=Elsinoe batatas TaxID=2601811 RepID=A0A8K0PJ04_9PEZI|nr:hypothetical protein KVT40_001666 [Elsinoe batatas]